VSTAPADVRAALLATVPEAAADPASVRLVRSPGRINLIGEHTDYNEGYVLPMAIDREVVIGLVPSGDRSVELTRLDTGAVARLELDGDYAPSGTWVDYLGGMATVLARRGVPTRGLRGVIASSLPIAVGLSSSAAFETAAALALADGDDMPLEPMELARAGQQVEHEFIGVNSGLMDQLAVILGQRDAALLIDCRSLERRPVRLPLERHAVVAIDSGSPRRLGSSAYNQRRTECEDVVAAVAARFPDVRALRDVDLEMLDAVRAGVSSAALDRAEHVIRENERVLGCVAALGREDLAAVGDLLAASHESLRDLFEVSSPQLDALVEIATSTPGVVGARMTGAGFGGSIVAIAERDAIGQLRQAIADEYPTGTGRRATLHVVEPADGAGTIDVGA
jgi:galactokinase